MTSLLPAKNSTPLEVALEQAISNEEELLPAVNSILSLKHVTRPSGILPFLVFEYGLEPLQPYIANLFDLIDEGRQWARYRGTHKAVHDGLGFIGYSATIIDPPIWRNAWADFQLELDRIRDDETDLIPIDGIVSLSHPVRSNLRRVFKDYDVPAGTFAFTRHGNAIWGDDSGIYIDGSDVKWSFGRYHDFTGTLSETDLTALGEWIPVVSSSKWVDMDFPWVTATFPWANPAELSRRQTIASGVAAKTVWLKFTDGSSDLIGYRLGKSIPVRAAVEGEFTVSGLGYACSDDDPTHILIFARTGFGDGSGTTAAQISILFDGTVSEKPGRLWRADVTGGVEIHAYPVSIEFGETVRDQIQILLEIS
ncbi:phage tail protein [Roseibium album]|uniref:phage tail protein n=1 Tax=Roseibium album TaxID=311410 RepID=UPI002492BB7C|nr:phage tail protein [Roseibium album]